IYYRVKNGVVFFSGSFVAIVQSPGKPLTTSSLPEGITPGDTYNTDSILSADCGVWYLPHVWFSRSERRPYLGGVIYLGNGSKVPVNTSVAIHFRGDASFVIG
ncbi:MAG TPA: hypothetical protein PLZ74_11080, partial [Kiritimatiellia bacterium]|nr:hypothetical protein [Kiritimatiellia bacterium]